MVLSRAPVLRQAVGPLGTVIRSLRERITLAEPVHYGTGRIILCHPPLTLPLLPPTVDV